jgi:AcrR family transcriptional regulator
MSAADPDPLPPTARGRATRDRIVSRAAELLLTHGLAALSLGNVRQAAAVSGSQLTHFFPEKDALISAVIARQIEVLLDFHRPGDRVARSTGARPTAPQAARGVNVCHLAD